MKRRTRNIVWSLLMILALLTAPLKVTAAEQNGESSDKQQNETTEQKTEETEETAPEMTTDLGLASPSVLLMEAQTGTVLYEKNASEQRSPASITKIMTLLLIFEELEKGTLQLTDEVTTSAHARSMGGSQVFLEEGEKQTVETMIKCIVVASGNDASVAMAEHIAGTESEFVSRMNQKAKELGMNDTKFEDCCGLTDSDGHYTTAADVAKMSRELIERFPQILNYSSIWMEEITHVTQKGSKPFILTNTNKLIRGYEGCVGLKTGSTSKAKYCVSAVAKKNDLTMLAVVMGAPDYKVRFADAASLFQYGFSSCSIYIDRERDPLPELSVVYGKQDTAELEYAEEFRYLTTGGTVIGEVEKTMELPEEVQAPIQKGECAGRVVYKADGEELGSVAILYGADVARAGMWDLFGCTMKQYFLGTA